MSGSSMNECAAKIAFLIDCDGGLGSAFYSKKTKLIKPDLIKDFPGNSDIFLFVNSHDTHALGKLESLKPQNPNVHVHVYPNIIRNARNGADMNLAFILGTIADKYGNYVIIARHDGAYDELKQRLTKTHPRLQDHVDLQRFENPKELAQYVRTKDYTCFTNQVKSMQVHQMNRCLSDGRTTISFTPENLFEHCPLAACEQSSCLYRFKHLLDHLKTQHPEVHYEYCSTCEQFMNRKNDPAEQDLFEEHLLKAHRENNAGFRLSIRFK